MELVRIVRKSLLCIVCLFIAMICISLYQINYNQDSKVYKYYKEIIADYNNIKNDNVAFTAEKLTKMYEQYKEEDSEYIEEAAGLIKEKENISKAIMQITSQRIITEYCRVHFLVMTIVFIYLMRINRLRIRKIVHLLM